jgi:Tripartite tricarboxylate transporter TctB family
MACGRMERMASKVRNQKDLYAGLAFIIAGVSFAYVATGYELGTANAMGPGYFPFGLGLLLSALGAAVLIKALGGYTDEESVERIDVTVVFWIIASIVVFGAVLEPLGLVASIFILVSVASLGSHELDLKQAVLAAAVLSVLCVVTFIYALGVQMPVWPSAIRS